MGEHPGDKQYCMRVTTHCSELKGNAVDLKLDLPNRQPLLDSERLMRWTPIPKHVIEVGLFGSGLFDWQFLFIADAAPRAVGDVGAWLLAHLYLYPEFPGLHAAEFDLSMSSLSPSRSAAASFLSGHATRHLGRSLDDCKNYRSLYRRDCDRLTDLCADCLDRWLNDGVAGRLDQDIIANKILIGKILLRRRNFRQGQMAASSGLMSPRSI